MTGSSGSVLLGRTLIVPLKSAVVENAIAKHYPRIEVQRKAEER
jgi:hypothetical protein